MSETTPAPRAYMLGAELRAAREDSGLGVRELARRLGVSHSVLIRWERGGRVPDTEHVAALLALIGVSACERDRLVELARDAAAEPVNLVSIGAAGEHSQLAALLEFERTAVRITEASPLLVPGLLQSGDYARAIMGQLPPSEVDTRTAMRLGRRDVITREREPAELVAFIGEAALRHPVVSPEVMADQCRLLVKLGKLPNVSVRIIPTSAGHTPAHVGPFVVIEFSRADPVVHLEHHRSSVFLRDREDVTAYHHVARDRIEKVAMSSSESLELIAESSTGKE